MVADSIGEFLPEPPEPPDPPLFVPGVFLLLSFSLPELILAIDVAILVKSFFSTPYLEFPLACLSPPFAPLESVEPRFLSIPDLNLDTGLLDFVFFPDLDMNLGCLDFVFSKLSVYSSMESIRYLGLIYIACSKHSPYVPSLPCIQVVTRFTLVFTNSESLVSSFRCVVYCFVDVVWKAHLCSEAICVFMLSIIDLVWEFHTILESFHYASDFCRVQLSVLSTDACVFIADVRAIVIAVSQVQDRGNLVLLEPHTVQILVLLITSNSFVYKHYGVSYGICSLCASSNCITLVIVLSLTCFKADILVDKAMFSLINLFM